MINNISALAVKTDNFCDYIPFISTLNNLTDLFIKLVLNFIDKNKINGSDYAIHVKKKSVLRSVVLLIPVIGNITVGIHDFVTRKENYRKMKSDNEVVVDPSGSNSQTYLHCKTPTTREGSLAALEEDGLMLKSIPYFFQLEADMVERAVEQNGLALEFALPDFKNNIPIVTLAVQQNGLALDFAISHLKNYMPLVTLAVQQNGLALEFAGPDCQNDKTLVTLAVQQNGLALEFAGPDCQNDKTLVKLAMEQNKLAVDYASEELKEKLNLEIF